MKAFMKFLMFAMWLTCVFGGIHDYIGCYKGFDGTLEAPFTAGTEGPDHHHAIADCIDYCVRNHASNYVGVSALVFTSSTTASQQYCYCAPTAPDPAEEVGPSHCSQRGEFCSSAQPDEACGDLTFFPAIAQYVAVYSTGLLAATTAAPSTPQPSTPSLTTVPVTTTLPPTTLPPTTVPLTTVALTTSATAATTAAPSPKPIPGPKKHCPRFFVGPNNPSGPNHPSGPDGPNECYGDSNPSGLSNPSGESNPAGPSNPKGPSNPSGNDNPSGEDHPSGKSNPAGPNNPKGPSGVAGRTGKTGKTGKTGPYHKN